MTATEEPGCSTGELLAVLLARDMADGERVIIGTNSDIQLAACNLARQLQAPRLWWVSGPGGMANPDRDFLMSTADFENIESAEAWMDLPQMVDFIDWQVHFFDFAILSAIQVGRFGNINTVVVGDPPGRGCVGRAPSASARCAACRSGSTWCSPDTIAALSCHGWTSSAAPGIWRVATRASGRCCARAPGICG